MQAAAAPSSIRAQAFGVIAARLGGPVSVEKKLAEVGTEAGAALLAELDRSFAIRLDAREVWPHMSLAALACLVEVKVADQARLGLMPGADIVPLFPATPEPWVPRQRIFPERSARELRLAARAAERRIFARLIGGAMAAGAFAAGIVFLLEPR